KRKHYTIYAQVNSSDTQTAAIVERRLALMEESLDAFYYLFAMQEDANRQARQPSFPKHRLIGILTASKEEFMTRHQEWGQVPMAADGFTPRRDNVLVMSTKVRLLDPVYQEYEMALAHKLKEANLKL